MSWKMCALHLGMSNFFYRQFLCDLQQRRERKWIIFFFHSTIKPTSDTHTFHTVLPLSLLRASIMSTAETAQSVKRQNWAPFVLQLHRSAAFSRISCDRTLIRQTNRFSWTFSQLNNNSLTHWAPLLGCVTRELLVFFIFYCSLHAYAGESSRWVVMIIYDSIVNYRFTLHKDHRYPRAALKPLLFSNEWQISRELISHEIQIQKGCRPSI